MKQRMQGNYTPKQYAAAIAFDALYWALQDRDLLPNDSAGYRARVRDQMKRLLIRIGDQHKFDFTLPEAVMCQQQHCVLSTARGSQGNAAHLQRARHAWCARGTLPQR